MDIYNYAKEYNADYYEPQTGYVYKVQEYNRALKEGKNPEGIKVFDIYGNYIGTVKK